MLINWVGPKESFVIDFFKKKKKKKTSGSFESSWETHEWQGPPGKMGKFSTNTMHLWLVFHWEGIKEKT